LLVNCWEYNAEFVVVVVNVTVIVDDPTVVTSPSHISIDCVATLGLVNCTGVRMRVHVVTPPPDTVASVMLVPATTPENTSTSPTVVGLTARVEWTDPNPVDASVPTAEIGSAITPSYVSGVDKST
jgi:hypothetical protein